MTTGVVRDWFRAKWPLFLPGVVYVESSAVASKTTDLPPPWGTYLFSGAGDAAISLGRPALWRENGTVGVQLFTPSGQGDAVLTAAAQACRQSFAACVDVLPSTTWPGARDQIWVQAVSAPRDLYAGDAPGEFAGVAVDLLYQFDHWGP